MDDIQGHYRFAGFQNSQFEAGIGPIDSRILWFNTDEADTKFKTRGTNTIESILKQCSAIVCYNEHHCH